MAQREERSDLLDDDELFDSESLDEQDRVGDQNDDEEQADELAELTLDEHLSRADELLGLAPQVTETKEDSDAVS